MMFDRLDVYARENPGLRQGNTDPRVSKDIDWEHKDYPVGRTVEILADGEIVEVVICSSKEKIIEPDSKKRFIMYRCETDIMSWEKLASVHGVTAGHPPAEYS